MTDKNYNIIIKAPFLTQSGYGVHARQLARWALDYADTNESVSVSFEPVPWGMTPWLVDRSAEDGLVGRIIERCVKADSTTFDISYQLMLPNEWKQMATVNVGMTALVEADRCNPEWIDCINRMNLVLVPSKFVQNTIINTAKLTNKELATPVVVVPESYITSIDKTDTELSSAFESVDLRLSNIKTKKNVLLYGQITAHGSNFIDGDRKNLGMTVKWLCEKFANQTDVGIIIKTNSGRNTNVDRVTSQQLLTQLLAEVEVHMQHSQASRKGKKGDKAPELPLVYLLHGDMTSDEVAALFRHPKVTCIASLTHGEGFGLPLLEAAASSLPVIATNWSAHTEFLNLGKWNKIDYAMGQVPESKCDNNIWMNGSSWANPKEDDFKKKISRAISNPQVPVEWARDLSKKIKENYSESVVSSLYTSVNDRIISQIQEREAQAKQS